MTNKQSVAVLGLGKMGYALAHRFLDAGISTTVWNRTMSKAEPLVQAGAVAAADAGEAVGSSTVIVLCLLDDDTVLNTLRPSKEALSGRTVINLTSESPEESRSMASWVEQAGARYLSGGIMATPDLIGTEAATIFYSGDASAMKEQRELLEALGRIEYFDDDPGTAPLFDIALLSGMYGMFAGTLHSIAMVKAAGHSATEFAPRLAAFLHEMANVSVTHYASRIEHGDYASEIGSPLAMQANGFHHFTDSAVKLGVRPDLLTGLEKLMHEAVEAGHGEHDAAAIYEVMRNES